MAPTATKRTNERTNERTPLLPQQPTRVVLDQCDRPIVDAMTVMPQPVDVGQCATVLTSFAAKDLREKDREDHLICASCTAPSKPTPPLESEAPEEEKKPTGEKPSVWRCWNCNVIHPRQENNQQLARSRFCTLQ